MNAFKLFTLFILTMLTAIGAAKGVFTTSECFFAGFMIAALVMLVDVCWRLESIEEELEDVNHRH